jgi:hypothetical protein
MTPELSPQPFDGFLESVAKASYADFRGRPGSEVESAAAFEEMRAYVLDLYKDVTADASRIEGDGQVVDCVPEDRHPAVRLSYGDFKPPGAPPARESYGAGPPSFVGPATREAIGISPRPPDPPGTLPMPRTTLERLARFPNLAAFSAKERLDAGMPTAAPIPPKRFATGEQDVNCLGGSSYLNVWRPYPAPTPYFQGTFSQQWYVGISDGTWLQTVECGWHVDVAKYGDAEPHLFVFTTLRNYEEQTGQNAYNLEKGWFRPATNPYVLPGTTRLLFSQTDGSQVSYRMAFYLTNGAWWFYFDDHPIGCYPLALFGNGPLAHGAIRLRFGGEVESRLSSWPPMGSGSHASAGYGKAAYHRMALVYPSGGGAADADLREAGSVTGSCYSVNIINASGTDWGSYLFFGGPGGLVC